MYDIIFISYDEEFADSNYQKLLERFPTAKRIHGIKGIHAAHKEAANISLTKMFWVVDADAEIVQSFNFIFNSAYKEIEYDTVYTYRSINPVNDLIYGYGGVKLLPKMLTMNVNINSVDMTTSISNKFIALPEISNKTNFNTDEFSTWRSAFRECAKLSSKIIQGQIDEETEKRLETWTTVGGDRRFGNSAIQGARHGRIFGNANRDNPSRLALINDYEWLYEQFSNNTLG